MKTKIKKFGIEIEGEFSEELRRELEYLEIGKFVSDGSINSCSRTNVRRLPNGHKVPLVCAEYVTDPFLYKNEEHEDLVNELFSLLDAYYDKGHFHFNKTMGMHIHFSFEPKLPSEIWSIEFVRYFEKQMKRTFPGVHSSRIEGTYCKRIRNEVEVSTGVDRYREINFRSAFNKHGTIEFRIFPTTNPKRMRRFLEFTKDRLNGFIRRERTMLSKSFEFEVAGKRRITRTQKVEVATGIIEDGEDSEVNRQNVSEEEIVERVIS